MWCMIKPFPVVIRPKSLFISSLLQSIDAAFTNQLSGYIIMEQSWLVMSPCVLPLRPSSLDWRTSHSHSNTLRNILFLSHNLHLFLSVWIQLIQLFKALMHNTQLWRFVQYRKIDRPILLLGPTVYWMLAFQEISLHCMTLTGIFHGALQL